jgi:hypothetical protein
MLQLQFGETQKLNRLAEKLATVPGCRITQGAVEVIGEDLAELCEDWEEAEWLVKEARSKWDEWKGRRGLIQLLDSRRRPELPPSNQAQDLGLKPEILCTICGDWGHYSNGKEHVWCDCQAAQDTRRAWPGLVDLINRKTKHDPLALEISRLAKSNAQQRRITQAEIDRAFSERRNAVNFVVADARSVLADESSSSDRKEIARTTLKVLGVAETEVSA